MMAFVKEEYISRFEEAASKCVEFAENHLGKTLPGKIKCSLGLKEQRDHAESEGKVKFLCGRFLAREEMENLPIYKAATYTFCDGKTPTWINLYFISADTENSYIQILTSKKVSSEELRNPIYPDKSVQFRLRLSENGEI